MKLPKSCSPCGSLSGVKSVNAATWTMASAFTQSGNSLTPDVITALPPRNVVRKASLSSRMRSVFTAAPLDEASKNERGRHGVTTADFAVPSVLVGLHLGRVVAALGHADGGTHAVCRSCLQ